MYNRKVSVIIPTYNRASTIKRSIDSVLNQTYSNLEVIVVDDGSTDDTEQIIRGYKDPRVHYVRTDGRRGANYARNVGIENAGGEYIAFQDSDDQWRLDKLEKQMSIFQMQADVDVVFSRFERRLMNGNTELVPNQNYTEEMLCKDIKHILSRGNVVSTQTMVVHKRCFEQYGMFDVEMPRFQDWEINIRFASNAIFSCIDEAMVEVYESEGSITNSKGSELEGLSMLVKKHENFFRRYGTLEYYLARLFLVSIEAGKVKELADCLKERLFYECIYAGAQRNRNMQSNYALVKEWISDDGYAEKINAFFEQYQEETVVIYGFGDVGKILVEKLSDRNKKKIKFLIDQNIAHKSEYRIRRLNDVMRKDWEEIKCIVITALAHESEIRMNLRNVVGNDIKVISVHDVVSEER